MYNYKTKNGKVKIFENTNLKFIEVTEYLISSPVRLTIYSVISSKFISKLRKLLI